MAPWQAALETAVGAHAQLQLGVEHTLHPSLPKALRRMQEEGLVIDHSCYLYPALELPIPELLEELLVRDLAHGTESLIPRTEARTLVRQLLTAVDAESTWLSNARWGRHPEGFWYPTGGWKPFTDHTFDAGWVWLAPSSVGYLWA